MKYAYCHMMGDNQCESTGIDVDRTFISLITENNKTWKLGEEKEKNEGLLDVVNKNM